MNYILLDLSYLIFYRYCALLVWWRMAKSDEDLPNPIENPEFVEKFKKTFVEKIREIPKKLKIDPKSVIFIGARDCHRQEIWRHKFCQDYKANRVFDDTFMGGPFFKMVYDENLIKLAGCNILLFHKYLEADDCIALATFALTKKYPESHIWIITNDHDYLQLASNNITLINLKYKKLTENKHCTGDPKKDLFCKIVLGDKSDNISSVFKKCGIKTALKCYDESDFFENMLNKDPKAREKFEKNKKIIDFNNIPEDLILDFMATFEY